jgi:hypothetical protein
LRVRHYVGVLQAIRSREASIAVSSSVYGGRLDGIVTSATFHL